MIYMFLAYVSSLAAKRRLTYHSMVRKYSLTHVIAAIRPKKKNIVQHVSNVSFAVIVLADLHISFRSLPEHPSVFVAI